MARDRVAGAALDLVERALELVVLERLHAPAVRADEVVMVLAARMRGLEAGDAGPEVDALEQALLGEQLEGAALDERGVEGGEPGRCG